MNALLLTTFFITRKALGGIEAAYKEFAANWNKCKVHGTQDKMLVVSMKATEQ